MGLERRVRVMGSDAARCSEMPARGAISTRARGYAQGCAGAPAVPPGPGCRVPRRVPAGAGAAGAAVDTCAERVKRWRGGEVEGWRGEEVERWRGGEVERWRGGEVGEWRVQRRCCTCHGGRSRPSCASWAASFFRMFSPMPWHMAVRKPQAMPNEFTARKESHCAWLKATRTPRNARFHTV